MLICDIETDGLLPELTRIHCIVVRDGTTVHTWGPDQIPEALEFLAHQPHIIGHNFQGFDIPAIQKVYPSWSYPGVVLDTLVTSRMLWPDLRGSHGIAQNSRTIISLERDQQGEGEERNRSLVRVLKCTHTGITGRAGVLKYDPATGRLTEDLGVDLFTGKEEF